ncbi:MAG: hypothetical protein N839_0008080 [Desulfofustis sp. PB-SRB1]|nr:hypothetical protein [Desulfofustis sp. PB-SRB1]MBM1002358.1 hypothetical protein [Desulfofustis sp. PB-SRB1]HBH30279.1 hypothetical protein [Desulfofustis sp.]HBH31265.1 hypothetical protein [Desulfofustis sp.]
MHRDTIWTPKIKRKFYAEEAIRTSGLDYLIFCPTWFMEVLPRYVVGPRTSVFGKQPIPYHFLAADDYAHMVVTAYALENPPQRRFIIHGPEPILFHDALKRFCALHHPDIKKVGTLPYWMANLIARISGDQEMREASDFMAAFEKIGERGDPMETNHLLGAPRITFEQWLQKSTHISQQ